MRLSLPTDYPRGTCALVAVDIALLPLVARAVQPYLEERIWVAADYETAYKAFSEVIAGMTALCVQDVTDRLDRLYRLIDAGLYGTVYTVTGSDPLTIAPDIADVPDSAIVSPGLLYRADQIVQLVDGSINGTETPIYGLPAESIRSQLQAILDAIMSGSTDLTEVLNDLTSIIALLG